MVQLQKREVREGRSAGDQTASISKKRDHKDLPAMFPIKVIPLPSAQNPFGAPPAAPGLLSYVFPPSLSSFIPSFLPFSPISGHCAGPGPRLATRPQNFKTPQPCPQGAPSPESKTEPEVETGSLLPRPRMGSVHRLHFIDELIHYGQSI